MFNGLKNCSKLSILSVIFLNNPYLKETYINNSREIFIQNNNQSSSLTIKNKEQNINKFEHFPLELLQKILFLSLNFNNKYENYANILCVNKCFCENLLISVHKNQFFPTIYKICESNNENCISSFDRYYIYYNISFVKSFELRNRNSCVEQWMITNRSKNLDDNIKKYISRFKENQEITAQYLNDLLISYTNPQTILIDNTKEMIVRQNIISKIYQEPDEYQNICSDTQQQKFNNIEPITLITTEPQNNKNLNPTVLLERKNNLLSVNMDPGLQPSILSINENSLLHDILFLEKEAFYYNIIFLKEVLNWLKQMYPSLFHSETTPKWLESFTKTVNFYTLNAKKAVIYLFSGICNVLNQDYKELNDHLQSLLQNYDFLISHKSMQKNWSTDTNLHNLLKTASLISAEKIDSKIDFLLKNMHRFSNLQNSKMVFFSLKNAHALYKERAKAITMLYIEWAKKNIEGIKLDYNETIFEIVDAVFMSVKGDIESFLTCENSLIPENLKFEYEKILSNKNLFSLIHFDALTKEIRQKIPILYKDWTISEKLIQEEDCFCDHRSLLQYLHSNIINIMNATHLHHNIKTPSILIDLQDKFRKVNTQLDIKEYYEKWSQELKKMGLSQTR